MTTTTVTKLRKKFMKMFANIPLGARDEIVAVVDGEKLTYTEIYWLIKDSEMVDEALEKMEALKIL